MRSPAGGPGCATSPAGTAASLATVLAPDSTLRPGASGSFDATGFELMTAPDGHPVFRPAGANRTQGAGDQNWRDGFGLPGTNGSVHAVVRSGSNIYIGGSFTAVGTTGANYVAKWNGSAWSALGMRLDGIVRALAIDGSNNVYAGATLSRRAEWRPTGWPSGTARPGQR